MIERLPNLPNSDVGAHVSTALPPFVGRVTPEPVRPIMEDWGGLWDNNGIYCD